MRLSWKGWFLWVVAPVAAIGPVVAQGASTLTLANASPASPGTIRFEIEATTTRGERIARRVELAYKESQRLDLPDRNGATRIRAFRADGTELAARDHAMREGFGYFVAFAGGSHGVPYALLQNEDSTRPVPHGWGMFQVANLATNPDVQPIAIHARTTVELPGRTSRYGYGMESDERADVQDLTAVPGCCGIRVEPSGVAGSGVQLPLQPGSRIRVLIVGDGTGAPIDLWVIDQGIGRTVAFVRPDVRMEGVWFSPEVPGVGLTISRSALPLSGGIDALINGYDRSGSPVWALFRSVEGRAPAILDLVAYRGGTPHGSNAAVPVTSGIAQVHFHACDELTLDGGSGNVSGIRYTNPQASRATFRRLLPTTACTAESGQEVRK